MSAGTFKRFVAFGPGLRGKFLAQHDHLEHLLEQLTTRRRTRWSVFDFERCVDVARGTGRTIHYQIDQ